MPTTRLHIDDKWSVDYDPDYNSLPVQWYRYDEPLALRLDNLRTALFYALLKERGSKGVMS